MQELQNIHTNSNNAHNIITAYIPNGYLTQLIKIENLSPTIQEQELIEVLFAAIDALPAKNKQVIELYYFENKSIEDIKNILGKSESTIRNHLKYGIFYLKKYFNNKLNYHAQ